MNEDSTQVVDQSQETQETTQETKDKTFTQSEVDAQISKSVENALSKREEKYNKDLREAVNKALAEAEKRAKMTDEERHSEELTAREKAIAEREAQAERKEFLADVKDELATKELPATFAELVVSASTRETADELIAQLKSDWDKAITEAIKATARQRDPKASDTTIQIEPQGEDLGEFARKIRKVGK